MSKGDFLKPLIRSEPYPNCYVFMKPYGWTSYTLVDVVKQLLGAQKAGHAGTLDPLATGELVVGVQGGTKFLNFWMESDKNYKVQMLLGVGTPSYDLETTKVDIRSVDNVPDVRTLEKVLKLVKAKTKIWVGTHSALKLEGTPFYVRAHEDGHNEVKKLEKLHKNTILGFTIERVTTLSASDLSEIINEKIDALAKSKELYRGLPIKHRRIQISLLDKFNLGLKTHVNQIRRYHSYKFVLVDLVLSVGKGTYVRYVIKQVSDMLGVPAVALGIHRSYRVNNQEVI